jgi:hypothetical protein
MAVRDSKLQIKIVLRVLANQTLEATAAAPGSMTVTGNTTSSASATPLPSGCASAFR